MKSNFRISLLGLFLSLSFLSQSQVSEIKLNPERVKMFTPYVEWKHGGKEKFESWKSTNKLLYTKEMWYYSESFYIKRNVHAEGQFLTDSYIDVSRLENQRKQDQEVVIDMPGFKDAVVLIPGNQLIYKP